MASEPHRIRPSNMGRTFSCPGWFKQSQFLELMADDEDDEDNRGTAMHKAISAIGRDHCFQEGDSWRWVVPDTWGDLSETELDAVRKCFDWLSVKAHGAVDVVFEFPLKVFDGLEGTADVVIIFANCIVIVDWKMYRQGLSREHAYIQLGTYAAGVSVEHFLGDVVVPINVYVYLPLAGPQTLYHRFEPEQIETVRQAIRDTVMLADKPDWWTRLNPTDENCRYCPCAGRCMAQQAVCRDLVPSDTNGTTLPMTLEQAERLCMWRSAFNSAAEEASRFLKDALRNGYESPSFKIERRRGDREIRRPMNAFHVLQQEQLMTGSRMVELGNYPVQNVLDCAADTYRALKESKGEKVTKKAALEYVEALLGSEVQRGADVEVLRRK